jgi:hypothetical protein
MQPQKVEDCGAAYGRLYCSWSERETVSGASAKLAGLALPGDSYLALLDVQGDNGATRWGCEGGAPNQLFRQGWRPDTLKVGEQITVEGFASRDGKPACNMRVLTRAIDGKRVFAGQAGDGAPAVPQQPGGAR